MSNLTANAVRAYEIGDTNNLPIKASTEIFLGSAVGMTSGYARQLNAGDIFAGFADEHQNNSVATDGAKTINVRTRGLVQLSVTSVAVTDIGKAVYASDGATFLLTQSTNTRIGTVYRYISSGVCVVKFDAQKVGGVEAITSITDSTTGSASGNTVDDTTSSVKDDIACLARKINEIIALLQH